MQIKHQSLGERLLVFFGTCNRATIFEVNSATQPKLKRKIFQAARSSDTSTNPCEVIPQLELLVPHCPYTGRLFPHAAEGKSQGPRCSSAKGIQLLITQLLPSSVRTCWNAGHSKSPLWLQLIMYIHMHVIVCQWKKDYVYIPTSISKYIPYHNISWIARITAHLVASWRGVRISAAVCETCASLSPQAKQKNHALKLPAISSVWAARHAPQIFKFETVHKSWWSCMSISYHWQLWEILVQKYLPCGSELVWSGLADTSAQEAFLFAFELRLTGYHAMQSFYKLFCQGASAEPFIPRLRKNASAVASMLVLGKSTAPGGLTVHHSSRWAANFF